MAPFLYMELCTIAAYGLGWVGMWNIMDLVSYILQVRVQCRSSQHARGYS
jgi:hypothetical protein